MRSGAKTPDAAQLGLGVGAGEAGAEAGEVVLVLEQEDLDVVEHWGEVGQDGVGVLLVVGDDAPHFLLEGEGGYLRVFLRKFGLLEQLCVHLRCQLHELSEAIALQSNPLLHYLLVVLPQLITKPLRRHHPPHQPLQHLPRLLLVVAHHLLQLRSQPLRRDLLGQPDVQQRPEGAGQGVEGVEDEHHCVEGAGVVAGQFGEGSAEHLVEGVEDIVIDETVIGEVYNGRDDQRVQSLEGRFDPVPRLTHRLLEEILGLRAVRQSLRTLLEEICICAAHAHHERGVLQSLVESEAHDGLHELDGVGTDLHEAGAADGALQLYLQLLLLLAGIVHLCQEMQAQSFQLVPDGHELLEVGLQLLQVLLFDGELVLEGDLVHLIVLPQPHQQLQNHSSRSYLKQPPQHHHQSLLPAHLHHVHPAAAGQRDDGLHGRLGHVEELVVAVAAADQGDGEELLLDLFKLLCRGGNAEIDDLLEGVRASLFVGVFADELQHLGQLSDAARVILGHLCVKRGLIFLLHLRDMTLHSLHKPIHELRLLLHPIVRLQIAQHLPRLAAQPVGQPLHLHAGSSAVDDPLDVLLAVLEFAHVDHDIADLPEGAGDGGGDVLMIVEQLIKGLQLGKRGLVYLEIAEGVADAGTAPAWVGVQVGDEVEQGGTALLGGHRSIIIEFNYWQLHAGHRPGTQGGQEGGQGEGGWREEKGGGGEERDEVCHVQS